MSAQRAANPERFISASELGEYAYCRRAWWLRTVEGVTTATQGRRFEAGRAAHWRHGASLLLARVLALAAILALLGAALLFFLRRSG